MGIDPIQEFRNQFRTLFDPELKGGRENRLLLRLQLNEVSIIPMLLP